MANVIFKTGTKAQYDALPQKDPNTIYWLYDEERSETLLFKGSTLYGTGTVATALAPGLMSSVDKKKLDAMDEKAGNLSPVDASVVVAEGENGKTVGVRLSQEAGNAAQLKEDGIYVEEPSIVWGEM